MKSKGLEKNDDFKQFKIKIFSRTIVMLILAIVSIYFLYVFFLRGNFANWVVVVFQKLFHIDYDAAVNLYFYTLRNYIELLFMIATGGVFCVVFRFYLNWFTDYFMEINQGIDTLMEGGEDVSLSPELSAIERKINIIKHTLERRKTDARLAEQRKNDLIVYLAHDLKTPLASVIGYLNLLRDAGQISDALREKYLSIALKKSEHLEDLINELFEIAKFNLTNVTLQYSRINLARLLEMTLYEFHPILKQKNLNCSLVMDDDIMLRCDANKIQRVFDNLLRNAVIYSFDGTDIDIAGSKQGDYIEVKFVNHGSTIPKEKIDLIFEQFYRADTSRNTSEGGAGLGLAIAKQIIELHNGTITAESEDETIEFRVMLPLS